MVKYTGRGLVVKRPGGWRFLCNSVQDLQISLLGGSEFAFCRFFLCSVCLFSPSVELCSFCLLCLSALSLCSVCLCLSVCLSACLSVSLPGLSLCPPVPNRVCSVCERLFWDSGCPKDSKSLSALFLSTCGHFVCLTLVAGQRVRNPTPLCSPRKPQPP